MVLTLSGFSQMRSSTVVCSWHQEYCSMYWPVQCRAWYHSFSNQKYLCRLVAKTFKSQETYSQVQAIRQTSSPWDLLYSSVLLVMSSLDLIAAVYSARHRFILHPFPTGQLKCSLSSFICCEDIRFIFGIKIIERSSCGTAGTTISVRWSRNWSCTTSATTLNGGSRR